MKKIILALAFISVFSTSFAQKTALEYLKSKINTTLNMTIKKYSDFGTYNGTYDVYSVVIIDAESKDDGNIIVTGEFSYPHNSHSDQRTVKYQATVKKILDDFSVIKIIYLSPKDKKWYKIFPVNDY